MTRNNADFNGYVISENDSNPYWHEFTAHKEGERVGSIAWKRDSNEVESLWVHPDHRRKGVGSALLREAKAKYPEVMPSTIRTKEGEAFISSVMPDAPKITENVRWTA